ncbi:MAG: Protein GrpE [Candidatus Roizmanbacteria bacterium GW2011_GWA2_36_23]|uniref:Protein GrpE n=1 Tax=Candidatus Roizmanbacteria bacterium GW2011_GWA2_36_23 TaxID=1618480 RepID=A0A0G0E9D6_9BACT|nr:MAG: Protein GrpE [Candidatus Roizmanbacteria bacterium GW2011_GWA2_36_23]
MDDKKLTPDKTKKHDCEEEMNKLKKELEQTKQNAEENKNKYLRALADYQNYEKRVRIEKEELIKRANKELLLRILPFLDNLEKAEMFVKDKGLIIAKDHFLQILKESGLEEIDILNKEYDPYVAEVIDLIEGNKDNIVIEVLRKGYKYNGQVIRVAQVKVSKKRIQNSESRI